MEALLYFFGIMKANNLSTRNFKGNETFERKDL